MIKPRRCPFDLAVVSVGHVLLLPACAVAALWWAASALAAALTLTFGLSSCWLGFQLFRLRPRARSLCLVRALGFICTGIVTSRSALIFLGAAGFCYFMSARMFALFGRVAPDTDDAVYSNGFERFMAEFRTQNEAVAARCRARVQAAEVPITTRDGEQE